MNQDRSLPPQLDFFIPFTADVGLRDQRETMERPFFSLAKRKRLQPIDYQSPDGSIWVKVQPHQDYGMATIWDADILIWAASMLTALRRQGINDIPRTLQFHPFDLLKAINRPIGGEHYDRLRAALGRLQTTTIRTNIRAKGSRKLRQFSWIEGYTDIVDEKSGQSRGMSLTLSDWLYEGILMEGGVLATAPEYFAISGGRERWLYRVARKHAGGHDGLGFAISLPSLFEKSGAEGTYRRFKHELKHIAMDNKLPEFFFQWEERAGEEPSLRMIRRSGLHESHPGYELPIPRSDRRRRRSQ
jgi:plasmid replication initiation protein